MTDAVKQKIATPQEIARMTAAAVSYHSALMAGPSPVGDYLAGRGLTIEDAVRFRLGWVHDPIEGHEFAAGWLCIPYLTPSGNVVSLKFRRLEEHKGGAKYLFDDQGVGPELFNASVLMGPGPAVICEGELDAIVASRLPVAAVGVAGIEMWVSHPWFKRLFEGHPEVILAADGDDAGEKLAGKIRSDLDHLRVVKFPDKLDVTSYAAAHGTGELARFLGVAKPEEM